MKPITTRIAGVTFRDGYPDNVLRLQPGQELFLVPDPNNRHDSNAVRVVARYDYGDQGFVEELGFLTRHTAAKIADAGGALPRVFVDQIQDYGYEDIGVTIRLVPPGKATHSSTTFTRSSRAPAYRGERARRRETEERRADHDIDGPPDIRLPDQLAIVAPRVTDERVAELAERFRDELLDCVDAWDFGGDVTKEVDITEWVATVRDIIETYITGLLGGEQ